MKTNGESRRMVASKYNQDLESPDHLKALSPIGSAV